MLNCLSIGYAGAVLRLACEPRRRQKLARAAHGARRAMDAALEARACASSGPGLKLAARCLAFGTRARGASREPRTRGARPKPKARTRARRSGCEARDPKRSARRAVLRTRGAKRSSGDVRFTVVAGLPALLALHMSRFPAQTPYGEALWARSYNGRSFSERPNAAAS